MAKGHVESEKRSVANVEAKTEPGGGLHFADIEVSPLGYGLPGVEEKCHVQSAKCFPAVLGIHDEDIVIVETVASKATQFLWPADPRFEVERNRLAVIGEVHHCAGAKRDDASSIKKRNVLLRFEFQSVEIVPPEILIVIAREIGPE